MEQSIVETPKAGYVEITSPQLLDDKWQEYTFDLASGQNVLQDLVMPETGAGYVYRDAKQLGTTTHNRFIYWRTSNDIIELVEMSTEVHLEDNQVRIRFVNSPLVNSVNVIELTDSIVIVMATITSVHRLYLPHPKTTNKSVLADLTSDVLFSPSNYYVIGQHGAVNSQHPISASSWFDKSMIKCALSFPDSSLLIVQFGHQTHNITTTDIKQSGIIGRLWSKMPNLWAKSPNECDNAVFSSAPIHIPQADDILLFTLCRDCRIRVFSTNTRECICSYNMIPQTSFHQSFSNQANSTCEVPMLKIFGSQVIVYLSEEFILLKHTYQDGSHELTEAIKVPAPSWEHIIDFALTNDKLWALGYSETEFTLHHMDLTNIVQDTHFDASILIDNQWFTVDAPEEPARSLVAEIFWSNRFSAETVRKALIGLAGPQIPKVNNMVDLEEFASTRIFDGDQDKQWTKFYNYCLQNHHKANKNIGLIAAEDGTVVSVIKRSNPSFICPWLLGADDSGPYRGIHLSHCYTGIIRDLNTISINLDDNLSNLFEQKLFEDPSQILTTIEDMIQNLSWRNWFKKINEDRLDDIEYICECLDLTTQSREFNDKILSELSSQMRSEHNPLGSNTGIIVTYEIFKQFVRARMTLSRDLLIYITILQKISENDKSCIEASKVDEIYAGKIKSILDCLRSYGVLVWLTETPVKNNAQQVGSDVINFLARHFEFFKAARHMPDKSQDTTIERVLHQNLFMSFLVGGGVEFSFLMSEISHEEQTLSNSYYATNITLNLCKLLWPKSNHSCLPEFMFTQQLDEQLEKYLDLTQDWLEDCDVERNFIRASNCLLQNRATHGVEIFNRLWMRIEPKNILGRFLGMDSEAADARDNLTVNPDLIFQYYEKLIQLFQIHNNRQCLVILINHCMSLIDERSDCEQQKRINCLRAKLFRYHLELEDSDEAYHTMVLTSDPSLRFNCLRKFIVSHCEKEQWMNLLSYPFIEIKEDFIDILNQKAQSLDLSTLNEDAFYKTSYYDLLYASHVSDDDYRGAAEIMYKYAQRLALEVPGITSIKKQADCLLVSLNTLRCIDEKEKFLEFKSASQSGESKAGKRSHDCESDSPANIQSGDTHETQVICIRVSCDEIEQKYELTRARLKLLEKDQSGNAIALSPLKPEEIVSQLVSSSMFTAALDLSLLFGTSMDHILEGLTAKYLLVLRLTAVEVSVVQDIERGLSDIFTASYSNINTYNFIANSTSSLVDKLWRLISYYLVTYDGVSHTYSSGEFDHTFGSTTVLMRVVASKILAAGYDVPSSLRRLYLQRNTSELLKLFMKYDKLIDAAELATEMVDRTLEPSNCLAFSSPNGSSKPPPLYLPTHLILLLISFLNEDATNTQNIKAANSLNDRLNRFRSFIKSN